MELAVDNSRSWVQIVSSCKLIKSKQFCALYYFDSKKYKAKKDRKKELKKEQTHTR
jgi:hypothetical protein